MRIPTVLAVLAVLVLLASCEAWGPELDALPPGDGAAVEGFAPDGPRVRAILPDGRVVMLDGDDLMPGRFVARSSRFQVRAATWAGE